MSRDSFQRKKELKFCDIPRFCCEKQSIKEYYLAEEAGIYDPICAIIQLTATCRIYELFPPMLGPDTIIALRSSPRLISLPTYCSFSGNNADNTGCRPLLISMVLQSLSNTGRQWSHCLATVAKDNKQSNSANLSTAFLQKSYISEKSFRNVSHAESAAIFNFSRAWHNFLKCSSTYSGLNLAHCFVEFTFTQFFGTWN